jgi:hypothetical protein
MTREGPPLELLLRRIAECPPELVDAVAVPDANFVAALLHDAMEDACGTPPELGTVAVPARALAADARLRRLAALAAWTLSGGLLREVSPSKAASLVTDELAARAATLDAAVAVSKDDRREEFARALLAALDLRPAGESEADAEDRHDALDGRARRGLLARTRDSLRRVREIRAAMRRKAEEEAAARLTGE